MKISKMHHGNGLMVSAIISSNFFFITGLLFTNPHQISLLFYYEEQLLTLLEDSGPDCWSEDVTEYKQLSEPRLKELNILNIELNGPEAKRLKREHYEEIMQKLVGNPIHVFSVVHRMVKILPAVLASLKSCNMTSEAELFEDTIRRRVKVTEADLVGAIQALIRIQFIYRQVRDISRLCQTEAHRLRPGRGPHLALAITWMEAALGLAGRQRPAVQQELLSLAVRHDLAVEAVERGEAGVLASEDLFLSKIVTSEGNVSSSRLLRRREREGRENLNDVLMFSLLCTGQTLPHTKPLSEEKCRLSALEDPYFLLAPLHIELLSEEPQISMFHDFLSNREMETMKQMIMVEMEWRMGQEGRTQSSDWLWDEEEPLLFQMSRRLSRATKLLTFKQEEEEEEEEEELLYVLEAEPWQVGVYTAGGHYIPHHDDLHGREKDAVSPKGVWVGNRVATAMAYLSDFQGGYTAFPNAGVAAKPRKGSLIFWYNLKSDGTRDLSSLHGACPTVMGTKWVANKWIREGAQIWNLPCQRQDKPPT